MDKKKAVYQREDAGFVRVVDEFMTYQSQVANTYDRRAIEALGFPRNIKRVLDIGCGNGHHLKNLKALFPDSSWVGIDINSQLIKKAGQLHEGSKDVTFKNISVFDYKPDAPFDAVFSTITLQYLADRMDDFFKQLDLFLKPGGAVFFFESEKSYNAIYPKNPSLVRLCAAIDQVVMDPCITIRIPHYLEKYGFKDIQYYPLIFNQYNADPDLYFKYLEYAARVTQIMAPAEYTAEDLNALLHIIRDKEFKKGMIYNFSGAYVVAKKGAAS
ncbi:MAG: methyltransferase domain-containing protein [Deltaproteobacteria bacterium]|nr:methyltransferase domain-containing protein [Deltaproteobacteria bacterium]